MKSERRESGFALLLVFALMSIMAITMYMALPRVAFESERDKEQLLIDRGEQYSRAIQLYVRKTKRFPGKIEDLENTNGIRFLRKQYIDPMTGKGEWRLVHAGPGGTLIDSLVQTQKKKEGPAAESTIAEMTTFSNPIGETNTNPALRHRPSDQTGVLGNANPGPIPPDPPPAGPTAANPNLPGRMTPMPLMPGQNPTQPAPTAGGGISILPSFGGPVTPAPIPIMPGQPPRPTQSPLPGQVPTAVQQQINNPTGVFPGAGGPNNATALIQNLLTTPRPGGLAGLQGPQQQQGQIVGGGIAGIASTYKGTGVKLYHDQDEFPKWEFVYDMAKDITMNPAAVLPKMSPAPGTPIGAVPPRDQMQGLPPVK